MVGRHNELAALLEAFDEAAAGRPRTVVVRGEAGVGKTRLVQEFLALVTTDDFGSGHPAAATDEAPGPVVAFGQCVDLGPIGAPFGPIRRVLRDLHDAVGTDALREAAGSAAAIASLAALVPGIADASAEPEEAGGEFAEAIEVLLEGLSRRRHVVVVLEDLQWADAATMALLKTLASTLRGRRLTIVATYRSDDIDRFHPLRPVLAELDRTRSVVRVEVLPLTLDEVAEQVDQLAGGLDPRVVEALAKRSGGIPFLVEELVDLGDRALPDTLRELVLARYTRLGADAQQVVRTMAAGGVHVDDDVLAAVAMLDERTLDDAVREAIDTRVIAADGAGYAFRHALTREAVEAEMLPSERVRVHRRYAEHLGAHRSDSPDDASAVAEHWLAARDLPAAFDATVAALRQSRTRFSPATSAKLAERLAELWEQVPDAEARAGTTLPALHLDAAQAWHDLGDAERALRSANEGLAVCPDDPLIRAALIRQRHVQTFNLEHTHTTRPADLDEAVALLEGVDDPRARVLLSRVLTNMAIDEHGTYAAEHAARAIALAEETGDDPALAVALTVEAWRLAGDEDQDSGALAPLERAVALRLDPPMRAYVGNALTHMLVSAGRLHEAVVVGTQHYEDVVRAGIERGSGAAIAQSVAFALFATGEPETALHYARRARRLMSRADAASTVRLLSSHLVWDDRPQERDDLLATERGRIEESQRLYPEKAAWWAVERADAALTLHAREGTDAATAVLAAAEHPESRTVRRYAVLTAALLTHSPGRAGDSEVRARVERALDGWPDNELAGRVSRFVRAVLADGDGAPADDRVTAWRAIVDELSPGGMPIWHLQTARCRLAWALIDAGERDDAADLLAAITAEAPPLGVTRVARWAAELAAQARLVPADTAAAAQTKAGIVASLTPRELQVLELIAEGFTNPQIGQRLFISPKTASVHVSAILAKIGAANRAEAAALYAAAVSASASA